MIRRKQGFSPRFANSGSEDVNPMDSVANFGDVMLVLCAAVIVALINFWGVDISSAEELATEKMKQVETDISAGEGSEQVGGEQYEEVGTVYKDKASGELYMIEE
jgi:hypothetical protein